MRLVIEIVYVFNQILTTHMVIWHAINLISGICTRLLSLDDGTQVGFQVSPHNMGSITSSITKWIVVPQNWEKLCRSQFVDKNGKCLGKGKSTKRVK